MLLTSHWFHVYPTHVIGLDSWSVVTVGLLFHVTDGIATDVVHIWALMTPVWVYAEYERIRSLAAAAT
jgi:hypothetical protein